MAAMWSKMFCAFVVAVVASLWGGVFLPNLPRCSDREVAVLGERFDAHIASLPELTVSSRGVLKRDRDTFFWSRFADKFGSNPNTPYMWNALPLFGSLLLSPMWNLARQDAVVLLSRLPPKVEYFSFTTFALLTPSRGLTFSSLGDSVNNLNIKHSDAGLFAHVVTGDQETYRLVEHALTSSGLPKSAINLMAIPSALGLFEEWTHFETVMRIFRFANQTEGDSYLKSHPPVFYLKASHDRTLVFPIQYYKEREHIDNVNERPLEAKFATDGEEALAKVGKAFGRRLPSVQHVQFEPLMIRGLDCLNNHTECLGDCPDAAYFGPHVREDSNDIEMLKLSTDTDLHLVAAVNHRLLNASCYGSIAVLKSASPSASTLSKTHMKVLATTIGVTSFDFPHRGLFVWWVFTRNPDHCAVLMDAQAVDGCSVVTEAEVKKDGYLTYCERIYLNPVTATGPHWNDILPARLYHIELDKASMIPRVFPPLPSGLPAPMPVAQFPSEPLRLLHIIKTGGESLQGYLDRQPMPRLDFSTCRKAAISGRWRNLSVSSLCLAAASGVSSALCGLNCECCAADIRLPKGGFHGTLLRSPRAHVLSLFTHGHNAHHSTLRRAASDVSLFLAELILRGTESACNSFNFGVSSQWETALGEQLVENPVEEARPLRVLPMHNTQAHALTCSKSNGSLGHHFRVLGEGGRDRLRPDLKAALKSLHSFEWVGLTDLFEPSLCLLHFQANGSVPHACDCNSPSRSEHSRLGHWTETRYDSSQRRGPESLSAEVLAKIDERTTVDAALFAAALRLLLGRLRTVETLTGVSLLQCIDWRRLWRDTNYVPGLWVGPEEFSSHDS